MTVSTRPEADALPALPPRPLWPGCQGPSAATPPRVLGSLRRTTSVDMLRPFGLTGDLHLVGRGRDLLTGADGAPRVLDTASMFVAMDAAGPRLISELRTDPAPAAIATLVGRSALSRFRGAARAALGDEHAGSLLAQLLDDVPVTTIVSSAAPMRMGVARDSLAGGSGSSRVDICAGWQADGALIRQRTAAPDAGPLNRHSPLASDLTAADPLGWHPMPALVPTGMRRLRRLDVTPLSALGGDEARAVPPGTAFVVESLVRDSFADPRDAEIVVHEFILRAAVAADATVLDARAHTGVVPGPQCPQAEPSAGRLVGRPAGELRDTVARTFVGVTTCTHLNDTLRTLGDLPRLLAALTG
ncbi:DUF2889 domain-containing protein [Frankia sp. CNm7]|uniref:DUF2889 domain-containing protein n=1 Tax=Frankia nepalensis TaxID=1836974 RepID=A0A937RKM0_9ACTN|nr:DUF2889 domain-containing protein [Frankia nepalensis]MBL7494737.1 DUF2889 domain-containing protein [Frankia nepalensis]MBL7513996.1 DUF2889 domain-containing protein [Frankia nepalensis]MBL7521153.1 DUF2889 domain-containing protein [Frankia nepalensis]MBL7628163.1 DUF2889 domain-containing protein [Frankia nepalensis]